METLHFAPQHRFSCGILCVRCHTIACSIDMLFSVLNQCSIHLVGCECSLCTVEQRKMTEFEREKERTSSIIIIYCSETVQSSYTCISMPKRLFTIPLHCEQTFRFFVLFIVFGVCMSVKGTNVSGAQNTVRNGSQRVRFAMCWYE